MKTRYFVIVAAPTPEAHRERAERHGTVVEGRIFRGDNDEIYGPVEIVPSRPEPPFDSAWITGKLRKDRSLPPRPGYEPVK